MVKKLHLVATDQERASRSDAFEVIGVSSATFVGVPQPCILNIPHSPENASVFRGFLFCPDFIIHSHLLISFLRKVNHPVTKDFLNQFDQAIENKSEIDFFKLATKICRKYAYYYSHLNNNITEDWELTADESVLKVLELVKNDNWSHTPNYYFGCLRNEVKWQHLKYLKEHRQEYSLEQVTTNSDGESFTDSIDLVPVREERTYNQEIELKAVRKIIELADDFKPRKVCEIESGIDHKVFLRLIRVWNIQFDNGNTRRFLECMKVYNVYKSLDYDIGLTRQYFKGTQLPFGIKTCIRCSEEYIKLFKNNRKVFMNRFVYPPNMSSWAEKVR
ncbi:MAG: hypothetical protein K5751_03310 [Treponemataceae bacterium]|nr:hypothetical protein [Treponemataceae bacterium]